MNLTIFGLLVELLWRCYGGFGFYNHSDIMTKMVWSQGGHIKWRLLYKERMLKKWAKNHLQKRLVKNCHQNDRKIKANVTS